jgi:hypothetical protein
MRISTTVFSVTVFILMLALVFAGQSFAQAQASGMAEMKATITKMQGEVVITKAGAAATQPLKIGDIVGSGDKIETMDNGKVEIKVDNGNTVNLTPNSQIVLSRLASDPATGEYENLMESKFGKMRAFVAAKVTGKSIFKIKTPTAICGARGTVFYLLISGNQTQVFVADGSVDFSNPTTGDTFVVITDMSSISSADGTVTEPVELQGADKAAVLAIYAESLSSGSDTPGGGDIPEGPSQGDNPQTPTDNPPPASPS